MRKQREDSCRNRLTPEQQAVVEGWLFRENLGYVKTVERIKDAFGVAMSVASVGRLYCYFARMRQARELVEAQVKVNHPEMKPESAEELRAMAMTLTSQAILHSSCEKPGTIKELLPYARMLLEGERNEILRRRLTLVEKKAEGSGKHAGK